MKHEPIGLIEKMIKAINPVIVINCSSFHTHSYYHKVKRGSHVAVGDIFEKEIDNTRRY